MVSRHIVTLWLTIAFNLIAQAQTPVDSVVVRSPANFPPITNPTDQNFRIPGMEGLNARLANPRDLRRYYAPGIETASGANFVSGWPDSIKFVIELDGKISYYSSRGERLNLGLPLDTSVVATQSFTKRYRIPIVSIAAGSPVGASGQGPRIEKYPSGEAHYIDYLGNLLKIENAAGRACIIQEQRVSGSTVLLTLPLPPDLSQLQITRDGIEIRAAAGDFTLDGNTLTLAVPANNDYFIIRSPL